jgi:hypothetical protein
MNYDGTRARPRADWCVSDGASRIWIKGKLEGDKDIWQLPEGEKGGTAHLAGPLNALGGGGGFLQSPRYKPTGNRLPFARAVAAAAVQN